MPKASRDALGAKGKSDVWNMDPNDVVLVQDKESALYDERVDNDFKESLVLNMLYAPDDTPQGVLKAVLGRRNRETGKVEIIDGRQRTKACREANKRLKKQGAEPLRLPVMLKNANDVRSMAMLISSNEHSTEDSPINRAKKAQRYIDLGRDPSEVATILGCSVASVKNLLSLIEAPAAVRSAVESGKISTTDAYRLSKLEPADARKKVAELLEHAPRTPGKKRSKNAAKAREIVGGVKERSDVQAAATMTKTYKRVEGEVAEAIAVWVEANWVDGWDGDPKEIPKRIRAGEWRVKKAEAAE